MTSEHFKEAEVEFDRNEHVGPDTSKVWSDVVHALRRYAAQTDLSGERYSDLLFRAAMVLRDIAGATGRLREESRTGKIFSINDIWHHATYRNLAGLDPVKIDIHRLSDAFGAYRSLPPMETPYLDWVFLDAYLYYVVSHCKEEIDEDVLSPWDTGTFLPRAESMMAHASEGERAHPLLLEIKVRTIRGAFRALPTVIGLAVGITLLYFDYLKTGIAIVSVVLLWRVLRLLRWIVRIPLRRKAGRFLGSVESAYGLLAGNIIPVKELRRAIDEALQIWGERLTFGVAFWAILDHVCAVYPTCLVLPTDSSRQQWQ